LTKLWRVADSSEKRRREVLRELRAHVEDFVSAGRQSGSSEEEIERLLLERFGDRDRFAAVCVACTGASGGAASRRVPDIHSSREPCHFSRHNPMQTWIMIGFGALSSSVHGTP
jgi:hypothetical protein